MIQGAFESICPVCLNI